MGVAAGAFVLIVLIILGVTIVLKSVALVPQAEAAVIERLGRYSKTVSGRSPSWCRSWTVSGPR